MMSGKAQPVAVEIDSLSAPINPALVPGQSPSISNIKGGDVENESRVERRE
jgi:hypothetical protein